MGHVASMSLVFAALAACLDVPNVYISGHFSCDADADCPTDWTCWERTDGRRRCIEVVECRSPDDAACDDGEVCTVDACDMDRAACTHEAAVGAVCSPGGCDAAAVYTPPSRCNASAECVGSEPVACDDPDDGCIEASCDADRGGCFAVPNLGLDCGVAGAWRGIFTRIDNSGRRDFLILPLELTLDVDLPSTWRFESSPGVFGTANAIDVIALSSGELMINDLDTALWLNVTPDREVIAGWDFGSIGPFFVVRVSDEAPPADGLAGRWRAFLVNRRDDSDTVRSRTFEAFGGPLELVGNGETACVATGGATLSASASTGLAPWLISDGACAALEADGGFTLQHRVVVGEGTTRQERWRGWLAPGRDVGVAVREVDAGGGFEAPSGFAFLVRESEEMPERGLDGAYAFNRLEHNAITEGGYYCWGQIEAEAGGVEGGIEICNNTSESCKWRDTTDIRDGVVTTSPSGALSARVFTAAGLTEVFGQAAPITEAVHASPIAIGQRLATTEDDGTPVARAGSLVLYVWQPPGTAPRTAPLNTREDPWCPPVSD